MAKTIVTRVDRNLARRLREARREVGLSTRAVCAKLPRRLKVSHTTLASYENGTTMPPTDVLAALAALGSLVPVIHLTVGMLMLNGALGDSKQDEVPLTIVGMMFVIIPAIIIVVGSTVSLLIAISGRRLARGIGYDYCLVVAAVECIFFPIGTLLGVFTILVLMRPSVKEIFAENACG